MRVFRLPDQGATTGAAGHFLETEAWADEKALDSFLYAHPEALSGALYPDEARNRLIPLGQQLWDTDILFLRLPTEEREDYALLVCEDKRATNRDLQRKVVAQAIDYVSLLHEMDPTEFERRLRERLDVARAASVVETHVLDIADGKEELPTRLVNAALAAKRAGRIEAVVCAERIGSRLRRMVTWLGRLNAESAPTWVTTTGVAPLGDGSKLVALGATLAEADNLELESLDDDELGRLRSRAAFLLRHPAFRLEAAGFELQGDMVRIDAALTVPSAVATTSVVATTTQAWLDKVPSPEVRALYVALSKALGSSAQWRPGGATGSQLVLELNVPGVAKALHLVRLKENRASLVFFGWLQKNGMTALERWARDQARNLGVDDETAPQPSLSDATLAQLATVEFGPLLGFVRDLRERIEDEA